MAEGAGGATQVDLHLFPVHVVTTLFGLTTVIWSADLFRDANSRLTFASIWVAALVMLLTTGIILLHAELALDRSRRTAAEPESFVSKEKLVGWVILGLGGLIFATIFFAGWLIFGSKGDSVNLGESALIGIVSVVWVMITRWIDTRVAIVQRAHAIERGEILGDTA